MVINDKCKFVITYAILAISIRQKKSYTLSVNNFYRIFILSHGRNCPDRRSTRRPETARNSFTSRWCRWFPFRETIAPSTLRAQLRGNHPSCHISRRFQTLILSLWRAVHRWSFPPIFRNEKLFASLFQTRRDTFGKAADFSMRDAREKKEICLNCTLCRTNSQ